MKTFLKQSIKMIRSQSGFGLSSAVFVTALAAASILSFVRLNTDSKKNTQNMAVIDSANSIFERISFFINDRDYCERFLNATQLADIPAGEKTAVPGGKLYFPESCNTAGSCTDVFLEVGQLVEKYPQVRVKELNWLGPVQTIGTNRHKVSLEVILDKELEETQLFGSKTSSRIFDVYFHGELVTPLTPNPDGFNLMHNYSCNSANSPENKICSNLGGAFVENLNGSGKPGCDLRSQALPVVSNLINTRLHTLSGSDREELYPLRPLDDEGRETGEYVSRFIFCALTETSVVKGGRCDLHLRTVDEGYSECAVDDEGEEDRPESCDRWILKMATQSDALSSVKCKATCFKLENPHTEEEGGGMGEGGEMGGGRSS